jgi:hypothetical protein
MMLAAKGPAILWAEFRPAVLDLIAVVDEHAALRPATPWPLALTAGALNDLVAQRQPLWRMIKRINFLRRWMG